jgi:adenosylcobinamide-phosphate synthase
MINVLVAFIAIIIDRIFGEFPFVKHPITVIGELITSFEEYFYKDSVFKGFLLVSSVIAVISVFAFSISFYLAQFNIIVNTFFSSIIASFFIAHNMLYNSVKEILSADNKKELLSKLVSRDVEPMSESDIYKASIETYAENLSDGVIAPIFYLLLFGLPGIILYKTINTMDSMIAYRNEKYEKFGKVAAKLDDYANYIPSRLTAVLIMLLAKSKEPFSFYTMGSKHESPNAGHPITAMALALHVRLGGDTFYDGKLKKKAYFGVGESTISASKLKEALSFRDKIDISLILSLTILFILIRLSH